MITMTASTAHVSKVIVLNALSHWLKYHTAAGAKPQTYLSVSASTQSPNQTLKALTYFAL